MSTPFPLPLSEHEYLDARWPGLLDIPLEAIHFDPVDTSLTPEEALMLIEEELERPIRSAA